MKRTFKKVLSTVVASLFVLQSASLATVGIGAADTNEVLKYTPTIDAVKDDAYATSYKKVVGDVTYSYLYDDSYIYLYAEGKMTVDVRSYLNITLTGTPVNAGVITSEGINFLIQPFHNPTAGVVGNVQTWQGIGGGQAKMGYNLSSGASASTEFAISVDGGNFIAEVRVANATALNKVVAFANGIYNAGTHVAGEGDYWGFWGDGSAPKYTALTLGKEYDTSHHHTWSDEYTVDVEPTCTTAGSKSYHCLTCGAKNADSVTSEGLEARGHRIADGACVVCGKHIVAMATPTLDAIKDEAYSSSYTYTKTMSWGSVDISFLYSDGYLYVYSEITDAAGKGSSDAFDMAVLISDKPGNMADVNTGVNICSNPFLDETHYHLRHWRSVMGSTETGDNIGWKGSCDAAPDKASNKGETAGTEYALKLTDTGAVLEYRLSGAFVKNAPVSFSACDTPNAWDNLWQGKDYVTLLLGDEFTPAHEHVWSDEWTTDVSATCTKMGIKSHHCTVAGCDVVRDQTDIPKAPHTEGELTTTKPTCVEEGKTTSVCKECGTTFTVGEPTPALGHTTTSGKCERCGEYVNSPSKVPYVTAAVDGTKDAAYDSGAKYYVNGATAYVVYDKDYFYAYVEAADAENVAYLTIGSPDNTPNVGGFWTNTASVKFDFTAKNLWTTESHFACSIFNQNGQSTFADNISVDTGATCIAKAGVDYAYADDANAVEIKIHIGEGTSANNNAGRAFVGSMMYYLGLGTETNGVNLSNNNGALANAIVSRNGIVNITLDKCLGGCVNTERVTTVEPTCTAVGTSVEKCTVCGAEVEGSAQDVAMLDHDYKRTVTVEATCEVAGTSAEKCTVCGAIKDGTAVEIPALGHDWEYTVDTAPTCTADGIAIARACKRTGCDVYEEGSFVLPALGHNYNELGICANCGDNKSLKVATYSVTLMDVLNINAKINKADVAAYDSFYVKFVEHYKNGAADNVKIVTEYSYESSKDRFVFAYGAAPQCAVDDVEVYVYGVKDGVTYETTSPYSCNITNYLYMMLARPYGDSLHRLMVHLLDYISAAQRYTGYSSGSLANANLTGEMKALRLPENTNYNNTFSETVNEGVSGATYLAKSLYCDDSVSFKYNFTFDASKYSTDNIKVVVKYKSTGYVRAEYTGDQICYDTNRSRYYVTVGVIAQDMSKDFEINVYTLDGTLISDKTVVNSIESLADLYSAYPMYSDLLAAIMQYGRAATKYVSGN